MKTAALICEFNPFHTGHQYLISAIREQLGFDRVVCFMSGSFVQRGEPAVMDKYLRAEDAMKAGADLVLELPMPFSVASSGWFAHAAVSMILKSGVCTHLVFGLEPGVSLEALNHESNIPIDPDALKARLKDGVRYADALHQLRHSDASVQNRNQTGSNALLALSYLEALNDLDHFGSIIPVSIERKGDVYGSIWPADGVFTSASALRTLLRESRFDSADPYLPFSHSHEKLCFPDALSMLLNEKLLQYGEYTQFWDVPESLSEHLKDTKYAPLSFTQRVEECLHSCYSRSRISRALLHITLGITTDQVMKHKEKGYVTFCRALAYRPDSKLLREIKKSGFLTVYTKNARFYEAEPDALYYDQIWHILTNTPSDYYKAPFIL